jgi:hypothetical protein
MSIENLDNKYQVGGCLSFNDPSYVKRQADDELYSSLKNRKFCYVLNSRQMGKSSLRVRTMQKLQENKNIICVAIDISTFNEPNVTAKQWYTNFLNRLVRGINEKISEKNNQLSLNGWLKDNEHLSPLEQLSGFIAEELLEKITQEIIIFVDEIDSLIGLSLQDNFFAFIRECSNNRADNPKYERLTFALLGVATPSELVKDTKRTPFNIESKAIELTGFQLSETEPLQKLLKEKVMPQVEGIK